MLLIRGFLFIVSLINYKSTSYSLSSFDFLLTLVSFPCLLYLLRQHLHQLLLHDIAEPVGLAEFAGDAVGALDGVAAVYLNSLSMSWRNVDVNFE